MQQRLDDELHRYKAWSNNGHDLLDYFYLYERVGHWAPGSRSPGDEWRCGIFGAPELASLAFRFPAPIGHYATETQPRGFQIDPTGAFLLAVGETSHGLSTYRIDRGTGVLERISRGQVGEGPNWVEIVALPSRSRDDSRRAEAIERQSDPGHVAAPPP